MNVILKPWDLEHEEQLTKISNQIDRTYLSNRIPYPYTRKDADWWITMSLESERASGIFRAIVCDGEYVGTISIERKSDVFSKDAEIGYYLIKEQSSKGIMTEAVRQICQIAWEELDIIRITGLVYEPNTASKKVLEKNGFVLEGIMKHAVCKSENIYDLCVYGKYRI